MKRSTIAEIITYPCITLFLYAGISKLLDFDISKEQLAMTPIAELAPGFIAMALPIAEIITAILLFIPKTRSVGFRIAFALMAIFTSYVIFVLSQDTQHPCTCGGVLQALSWPQHLALNLTFLVLIGFGIKWTLHDTQRPTSNIAHA